MIPFTLGFLSAADDGGPLNWIQMLFLLGVIVYVGVALYRWSKDQTNIND